MIGLYAVVAFFLHKLHGVHLVVADDAASGAFLVVKVVLGDVHVDVVFVLDAAFSLVVLIGASHGQHGSLD